MKNRYDGIPSKDSMIMRDQQTRLEQEHAAKNQFVKKQQAELDKYAGKAPDMPEAAMNFNAYMTNNGMKAQEFARDLTKSLDKTAFPVK